MENPHFLIIDDNLMDRYLHKDILHYHNPNLKITEAPDGEIALKILSELETPPAVIMLDINMPRMNGFEFLEIYNRQYGLSNAVVAMLTSSNFETEMRRSMSYDFVKGYFSKPLQDEDVDKLFSLAMVAN